MTPATTKAATPAAITAWAASGSLTKQLAALVARETALLPPRTQVESSMKIAAKYGVSHAMAVKARQLLAGANLIHKHGRRYYTGQPERATHASRSPEDPRTAPRKS